MKPNVDLAIARKGHVKTSALFFRLCAGNRTTKSYNENNLWKSKCIKVYFKAIQVKVEFNGAEKGNSVLSVKPTVTAECGSGTETSITAEYDETKV